MWREKKSFYGDQCLGGSAAAGCGNKQKLLTFAFFPPFSLLVTVSEILQALYDGDLPWALADKVSWVSDRMWNCKLHFLCMLLTLSQLNLMRIYIASQFLD